MSIDIVRVRRGSRGRSASGRIQKLDMARFRRRH